MFLRIPAAQRGLLSVVVPVYGVEKYVRGAIRSLLDQEYRPLEIIVVDDESPDGSIRIVNSIRWRNPAVRVIRQKNAGLGA
ncbi:MAG TPA: glycosyltransferase family 2 protein, partial [Microbacterium sp.]|nr:glycosyltransferase family 2 protein [Microbacterium sp.]